MFHNLKLGRINQFQSFETRNKKMTAQHIKQHIYQSMDQFVPWM